MAGSWLASKGNSFWVLPLLFHAYKAASKSPLTTPHVERSQPTRASHSTHTVEALTLTLNVDDLLHSSFVGPRHLVHRQDGLATLDAALETGNVRSALCGSTGSTPKPPQSQAPLAQRAKQQVEDPSRSCPAALGQDLLLGPGAPTRWPSTFVLKS